MSVSWRDAIEPEQAEARIRAGFLAAFGAEPTAVHSAPGRVNLIGEHTDYNGGLCLPIALPHRTYAAIRLRDDDTIRLTSAQTDAPWTTRLSEVTPGGVSGWGSYIAGVAWALKGRGYRVPGFDLSVDSAVPFGSGLSSSAALEASVAMALDSQLGLSLGSSDAGRAELVEVCIEAENKIAGAATGGMDQTASLCCSEGHALLLDCRSGETRQVPFDPAAQDLALLVIDTRAEHSHADGDYADRRADCERAAKLLGVESLREITNFEAAVSRLADERLQRRVRHVVGEIQRTEKFVYLLDNGLLAQSGNLLDASHESLRSDYEVSCAELDLAVAAARAAGALGARMTGGGFGGSAIALVRAEGVDRVCEAVASAFELHGYRSPAFLPAPASSAAR